MIDFAVEIGWPLDPWERWAIVHLGELLADGRPRFRRFLLLVARQNGKTLLMRVLILYWMFIDTVPLILGTHIDRDMARKSWLATIKMAETTPVLAAELPAQHKRITVGQESFWNDHESVFCFSAPNSSAGRGDSVHRTLLDEVRELHDWDAYAAAMYAMQTVDDAQLVGLSNAGTDASIVLDALRDDAIAFIETGIGDPRLGIAEWSAPPGSSPTDPAALAAANPNLGHRIDLDSLMGEAVSAVRAGGEQLAMFKTEAMCMRVYSMNPAVSEERWKECGTDTPIDMAGYRRQVALCLDVAMDGSHAAVVAAVVVDDIVHLEVVETWIGFGCTKAMREALPALVARIRPGRVGWFPAGPAAAVAARVKAPSGQRTWYPRRTEVSEIIAETPSVCMGFADIVDGLEVRHPRDDALTGHVTRTERLPRGDAWVFTRRGTHPINLAYGAAGAAHLARTMPPPPPPLSAV